MVKKAMAEAFAVVLDEFRDATLKDSAVLESVGRQIHGVTGGQMREFAQRLRDAALRPLTAEQILAWSDMHLQRTGDWPTQRSGPVLDALDETWKGIDSALRVGGRGLPDGSSLAQLLAENRGVQNPAALPPLTKDQILSWADAHHNRTGTWPTAESGPIADSLGGTWANIDMALRRGNRGLPDGSSLAQLLTENRSVRHHLNLPLLTEEQILEWADAHHKRTGDWPTQRSGPVLDVLDETWKGIDSALLVGGRSLPDGSSLAQLLAKKRGVRNLAVLPLLTKEQILSWVDAHLERTEQWPTADSGPIDGVVGETWQNIDAALAKGRRGLVGGSSLAQLLAEERGVRHHLKLPPLTEGQILKWADAHKERTGDWPTQRSGSLLDAPGETWKGIDSALRVGRRGLPGGSSFARLIQEHRGRSDS